MIRSATLKLTVISGAEPGRAWEVAPGGMFRIGSSAVGELVLVGDAEVAETHCTLFWVGEECRVRDAGFGGTWVNGTGVWEQTLRVGDVVQCGRTQLRLVVVATEVAGDEATEEDPKAYALQVLRGLPGKLYAVLDAARDPEILQLLRRSGYQYECLWGGWAGEVYGDVAPYLVRLRKDGRLLEQLLERGWGKGWGIYITASSSTSTLRRQLRRQLRVHTHDVGRVALRFFDPDVMTTMLRHFEPEQVRAVFGSVEFIVAESIDLQGGEGDASSVSGAVTVYRCPADPMHKHSEGQQTVFITKNQMRFLSIRRADTFLDRVTDRILTDFPDEFGDLPYKTVRDRVRIASDRFREFGFQRKEHLHRLIVLELLFGPRFETQLPEEARLAAFPLPDTAHNSEVERFWTVYRAADRLSREGAVSTRESEDGVDRS